VQATEECRNVCHVVRLKRNKEVLESLLDSKHLLQYRFKCDEVLFAYERMQSDALEWSEVGQVRASAELKTCVLCIFIAGVCVSANAEGGLRRHLRRAGQPRSASLLDTHALNARWVILIKTYNNTQVLRELLPDVSGEGQRMALANLKEKCPDQHGPVEHALLKRLVFSDQWCVKEEPRREDASTPMAPSVSELEELQMCGPHSSRRCLPAHVSPPPLRLPLPLPDYRGSRHGGGCAICGWLYVQKLVGGARRGTWAVPHGAVRSGDVSQGGGGGGPTAVNAVGGAPPRQPPPGRYAPHSSPKLCSNRLDSDSVRRRQRQPGCY
jgi:hypothetical protein